MSEPASPSEPALGATPPEIRENPAAHRFEALIDGRVVGIAEYLLGPDEIVFTHTEVDPAYRGGRIGFALVRTALDAARERGLWVVPACSFFRAFIRGHRDYRDLVRP
jgi:predicted GNAT family acetyltransferase